VKGQEARGHPGDRVPGRTDSGRMTPGCDGLDDGAVGVGRMMDIEMAFRLLGAGSRTCWLRIMFRDLS
jgi:hypothetical protein